MDRNTKIRANQLKDNDLKPKDLASTNSEFDGAVAEYDSSNLKFTWVANEIIGGGTSSFTKLFTNADLSSAGVLSVNHDLGFNYPDIIVYDNNGKKITPDEITNVDSNNLNIDLSSYGTLTGTWKATIKAGNTGQLVLTVDGAGNSITTGEKAWVRLPTNVTIVGWELTADIVGSVEIDIWIDSYSNYPPTVADTIIGSAGTKPNLSSTKKNTSSDLTGWTTSLNKGDYIKFNIDSLDTGTSITKLVLVLKFQ